MINKKILVIRYGTIGDTIFASAFFRELRKNLPNSIIDALVDNVAKGIMESCPYIDNIVHINKNYKKIFEYIKIFKQYDTIYFLKNDSFFSIVAFLAGVKNRIGFKVFRNRRNEHLFKRSSCKRNVRLRKKIHRFTINFP